MNGAIWIRQSGSGTECTLAADCARQIRSWFDSQRKPEELRRILGSLRAERARCKVWMASFPEGSVAYIERMCQCVLRDPTLIWVMRDYLNGSAPSGLYGPAWAREVLRALEGDSEVDYV